MPWPADPEHDYSLWLETTATSGLHRAYVTAHPKDNRGGTRSRFAVRLDLPGKYSSKIQAEAAAFHIANRFFRRKFAAPECEVSTAVKGYVITARARFRIDCHEWEPVLWIKSTRPVNKGAIQTFDSNNSPFHKTTFPTAVTAARYALSYGERVALGLIGGLHV
jgi:hypothetical protein